MSTCMTCNGQHGADDACPAVVAAAEHARCYWLSVPRPPPPPMYGKRRNHCSLCLKRAIAASAERVRA